MLTALLSAEARPASRGHTSSAALGVRDSAMEVSAERIGGILIIVGSALFLCAAFTRFLPVSPERSAARKLEVIRDSPTAWSVRQIMFGLGALVT